MNLKINLTYDKKLQKEYHSIQKISDGNIKRLRGNDILLVYRIRILKYRILFHINEIKILKVDSRGIIYK